MLDIPLFDSTGRRVFWTPMGGAITTQKVQHSARVTIYRMTDYVQPIKRDNPGISPLYNNDNPIDRPYFRLDGEWFYIIDEIHEWIVAQGWKRYVIDYRWLDLTESIGWAVGFPEDTQAAIYNLRWT